MPSDRYHKPLAPILPEDDGHRHHPRGVEVAPGLRTRDPGGLDQAALRGRSRALLGPGMTIVPKIEHLLDDAKAIHRALLQELKDKLDRGEELDRHQRAEYHKLVESLSRLGREEREEAKTDNSIDATDEDLEAVVLAYARERGYKLVKGDSED